MSVITKIVEKQNLSQTEYTNRRHEVICRLDSYNAELFAKKLSKYYNSLVDTCALFDITSKNRIAHFLGQTAHESLYYRYTRELWGPTKQQKRYEPGTSLAKTLGNTQPGDGYRYAGRGFIQLTGRSNYEQITRDLGVDFVANPDLLCDDSMVFLSAGWYWSTRNLNLYADKDDVRTLTRKINGGYNGLNDRIQKTDKAKEYVK